MVSDRGREKRTGERVERRKRRGRGKRCEGEAQEVSLIGSRAKRTEEVRQLLMPKKDKFKSKKDEG